MSPHSSPPRPSSSELTRLRHRRHRFNGPPPTLCVINGMPSSLYSSVSTLLGHLQGLYQATTRTGTRTLSWGSWRLGATARAVARSSPLANPFEATFTPPAAATSVAPLRLHQRRKALPAAASAASGAAELRPRDDAPSFIVDTYLPATASPGTSTTDEGNDARTPLAAPRLGRLPETVSAESIDGEAFPTLRSSPFPGA